MQRKWTAVGLAALVITCGAIAIVGVPFATHADTPTDPMLSLEPASPEQRAALADGVVTEGELRAGLNAGADCLEANGVGAVRVGHPQLEGNLVFGAFFPDGQDPATKSDIVRQCQERHVIFLSAKWGEQREAAGLKKY